MQNAVFSSWVVGMLADDSGVAWDWRIEYPVTQTEFENALFFANNAVNTNVYNFLTANCVDFLQGLAADIDLPIPDWTDTSYSGTVIGAVNTVTRVADGSGMTSSFKQIASADGSEYFFKDSNDNNRMAIVAQTDGKTIGNAPDPPGPIDPGSPWPLAQAALSDPSGTASLYQYAFSAAQLGTANVATGATFTLTENPSSDTTSMTLTAIDWGDGSPPNYTMAESPATGGPIAFTHTYATPGTYTDKVIVIEDGRLAEWTGSVVAGSQGGGSQSFTVPTPGPYVSYGLSNPGSVPNSPGSDTTPPTTTASLSPQPNVAGWNNTSVQVTLTATDNPGGSGVATTYYAKDNAACRPSSLASCTTYASPFSVSGDGTHMVYFFSVDNAGNYEQPQSRGIKIDTTPPALTFAFSPNGAAGWFKSAPATGTITATDGGSGVAGITCSDSVTNGLTTGALTGGGTGSASRTLSVTGDGVHTIICTATDVAGNGSGQQTATVKIDTTLPSCPVSASPSTLWPPNGKPVSVSVTLTISDAVSGVASAVAGAVTSNESLGSGDVQGLTLNKTFSPPQTGSTTLTVTGELAAKRNGNGNGRTYTQTITVQSAAGKTTLCSWTITVPHDQGQ